MGGPQSVGGSAGNAGVMNPSEAARRAEEARQRAEAARQAAEAARKAAEAARQAAQPAPRAAGAAQKQQAGARPRANEAVSAFAGSNRKAELEKLLGTTAPPPSQSAQGGEKPPASLDAVDARDAQAARRVPDGQTFTDPSSGTKYQVRQDATTGETVLPDSASGSTVTIKPDGSYTSTATVKEPGKEGGTRDTTWTKSSDAQGRPTGLKSEQRHTAQHPETGATTTTTSTEYNLSRSPPVPQSRTEQVRMERPPAALAQRQGFPQGPVTVKTETRFNAEGLPAKQVKTTEARTPGFNANDVGGFESGSNGAFQNAAKGADHHHTNNAPTNLKAGESSLTLTEETLFNAKGEPAVSKQKTDSVAVKPMPGDTNGNGVQVVRSQQQVNRGPADATSAAGLPALPRPGSGTVSNTTTVTGYDPDGSHFDKGHARRTQTVSRSSGTVDANGTPQLKHEPTEVKSLQEGGGNRWTYDHVSLQVGADGKPVAGQKPKELDRERQLPWHQDVQDFAASRLQDVMDLAGNVASDALEFAKDVVLAPLDGAIDQVTQPLEEKLTDEVKKLNSPGDTLTLSGGLDVKLGLKGGLEGEAEIERTADGKYQLSAEVTGNFGVGVLGSASLNAGGRMELTFDTPEEAARAAIIMGKGPAAIASGGEDQKFMRDHLSAVEVYETAFDDVDVDAKMTTGSFKDREAGIDLKLGVVDFNVSARHRDVTAEGGNGNGSTTVSVGKGKRGESDGTSGGSKPAGSSPPPPTNYRVNPATGKLVPVPPTEAKPPATSVPVITNPELPGRTTHVRYDKGGVRIEAGPQATPQDIQAHMETARILQRYEGAVGKVRQLIDKVKQAITGMPGYGSQGFESRLEVQKLNNILKGLEATQKQLDTRAAGVAKGGSPATQAEREQLQMELAQVSAQLRVHEAQVDSLARGRGYVAREDTPPLSPEDRKKALDLLHKAEGPNRWKNLLSQYEGKENEATRNLLHRYRATIVSEAINEAATRQEGKAPAVKCTPEALMSKEGWTSPDGVHFKASGSTNATSDLDVSITGPDSKPVASLMMDFNQLLNEETGVDPNTLLDANILDKTEVPKGESWKAISEELNASERKFVQAAALMSDEHRETLRRLAEAGGLKLDPEAEALAKKAKAMLEEGVETLRTQRPDLTEEELRKEAGNNIYQGFLQTVDKLAADRDALLQQFKAEGKHYDPQTGANDLDDEQARQLNELNVSLHENHMWARLFATEDYTTPSTIVDIVDNRQGGSQRELSPGQYRISAQENAWFAGEHLGNASPREAVDASKYIDRTLRALQNSGPGSEADKVLGRVLGDKEHGMGRLLAFRSDPALTKFAQTPEGQKAVAQATRELEKQLKDVLTALGVKPPTGGPRELMMALWVHAAKVPPPGEAPAAA